MSLFDYDARPVTPQVTLVGRASPVAYGIRDFLQRNGENFNWVDVDQPGAIDALPESQRPDLDRLPLCVLPDGRRLEPASVEEVARGLGMIAAPGFDEYDVAIVGAGPSGLAAAVYAASEGLRTVVLESVAPGGQAGTTSLIENYLGFPNGVSGNTLANSAAVQARRFGAEILLARPVTRIERDGARYRTELSDATAIDSRSVIVASGVEWRRLDVAGIDDLIGAGVFYGAGPSEAKMCAGGRVVIVGGGNSAGQAVVRFSKYAREVQLLVRGDIERSMSRYLIERITPLRNVHIRNGAQVVGFEADARLREITVALRGESEPVRMPVDALFICIGGTPRSASAAALGVATDAAGYLVTGGALDSDSVYGAAWDVARQPLPLETSMPGVFAAGDVRSGSTKRCATAIGEGAMSVALVHQHLADAE